MAAIAERVTASAAMKRPNLPQLLTTVTERAQRLSIATRSWPAFAPTRAALDGATDAATELQNALDELRAAL